MPRRAVLVGMTAGIVALPVVAGAAYLAYRNWLGSQVDPHYLLTYSGHEGAMNAAWSPDGTRVASTVWDAGVQVWTATTGKKLLTCTLEHPEPGVNPQGIVWSADGKYLLAFFGEYSSVPTNNTFKDQIVAMVQVWDATTGQRVRHIQVIPPITITGAISDAAILNNYTHVTHWALNERYLAVTKSLPTSPQQQDAANASSAAPSSPTSQLAATFLQPTQPTPTPFPTPTPAPTPPPPPSTSLPTDVTEIWDVATGSKVFTLDPGSQSAANRPTAQNRVQAMVWAPNSGMLAVSTVGQLNNMWEIWDIPSGKMIRTFPVASGTDTILAWSFDGRSIAVGTTVYDVQTGFQIAAYTVVGRLVEQAWSPDGKHIVASSFTRAGLYANTYGTIYIIDAASGKQVAKYSEGQIDPVVAAPVSSQAIAWSPNGKEILVLRKGVEIWRAD